MAQSTEIEFGQRVADAIEQLDYKITTESLARSEHGAWSDRIFSWLMEPPQPLPRPDISVKHGEKVVLIEAKPYPVLLGPIIQARHYADYFQAPIIVCVPDDAFQQIPDSVREWAEANDVVLSPFGEIGDNLKLLL